MSFQCPAQLGHEVGRQHLPRGDVDAGRQIQPQFVPAGQRGYRFLDDVIADFDDEIVVLQLRQKCARQNDGTIRLLPAYQCLGTHHMPVHQIHFGLPVQHEISVLQPGVNLALQFAQFLRLLIVFGIEVVHAIAAQLLGLIHRLIGVAQQHIGIVMVGRVERDADTGRNAHLDAVVQFARPGHDFQHARQYRLALLFIGQVGQQQNKLVAAQAGDRVLGADEFLQAPGDLRQHAVARLVSVTVVDRLETVQIQIADRNDLVHAVGAGNRLLHPVRQQHAIGQTGQRIVIGQVFDLLLLLFVFGDVGKNADIVRGFTRRILHRRDAELFRILLAVLAPVPQLARPMLRLQQLLPQLGYRTRCPCRPDLSTRGVLPNTSSSLKPGDLGKCTVDIDHCPRGIGDQNAFARIVEHAGGQFDLLLRLLALGDVAPDRQQIALAAYIHRTAAHLGHAHGAVLAQMRNLQQVVAALFQMLLHHLLNLLVRLHRLQVGQRQFGEFFARISQALMRHRIELGEPQRLAVDQHDGIRRLIDQGAVDFLAFAQFLVPRPCVRRAEPPAHADCRRSIPDRCAPASPAG